MDARDHGDDRYEEGLSWDFGKNPQLLRLAFASRLHEVAKGLKPDTYK